jgi:RHS repeat-associated protein
MLENRLSATRDQYYATANIYDASGNRAWKLGGEVNWMWNNGQGWQAYGDLNLRTWYQSDLVTITDQAMTKHYFISGQRIASKLAESLAPEVAHALKDKPVTLLSSDLKELGANMAVRIKRDFNCVGLDYNAFYPGEPHLEALENLLKTPEQPDEYQLYFYHSDHLGSSSFITDINGDATQHLQYLPFGEDFVHQQNTAAYYTPYTFSGKERDVETNLSYFGARYYEAGLSVWLSVDPMADKFPNISSYNYCSWNPVKLKDPDGNNPILGFAIGFALDVITQVAIEGKAINDVNYWQSTISGGSSALSGGISAVKNFSTAARVATEMVVDAAASAAQQAVDPETKNIDPIKMITDAALGQAGSKAKVVGNQELKVQQNAVSRTQRIAANDPTSTGRAANASNAQQALKTSHNMNNAAATGTTGVLQSTVGNIVTTPEASSSILNTNPIQVTPQDNTRVVTPVIIQP